MQKYVFKSLAILLGIGILLVPAGKLIFIFVKTYSKSYSLEIDSYENVLTRYVFDKNTSSTNLAALPGSGREVFGQVTLGRKKLDEFYSAMIKEYAIEENPTQVKDFYAQALQLKTLNEINKLDPSRSETFIKPILGENDGDIIGNVRKMEILHNFDDTGIDPLQSTVKGNPDDHVARKMDEEGKPFEIDSYLSDHYLKDYRVNPDSLRLALGKKFYTSPKPDNSKKNSLQTLKNLKLIVGKDEYYSFEIVRYNLISLKSVNIDDLKIYVIRGKYVFPNVGGKNDLFFKYRKNKITGTAAMGYNPPPGRYNILVKSKTNPEWKGIQASFRLIRRSVPKLPRGFSVVTMEHTVPLVKTSIRGPNAEKGGFEKIVEWVEYMSADALWMLVAQTTGWSPSIAPKSPWIRGGFKNLELLAPLLKQKNIQVGAYIMSYFTPANGKAKAGYDPSLGYSSQSDRLQDTYHISLNCEKRFKDIIAVAKKFEVHPHVDYIGVDFIRTGRADGYEMGPQVIEDMNIPVPPKYHRYSYIQKVKWFARNVEDQRNQRLIKKWRWWRATKTASIINRLIIEAKLTKPVWVFTLGWEHGKQHGQDPYMMFDAGAMIDAVMLYEANEKQFQNMMIQWPSYMRNNRNNIMIGNACDIRLLDSSTRNVPADFVYRQMRGYRDVYREGMAKGIFFHDISRALWSSKRGLTTIEWAIVNGHTISAYRNESGLIPYRAEIDFKSDKKNGTIKIIHTGDEVISDIHMEVIPTQAWKSIQVEKHRSFDLRPGETVKISFRAEPKEKYKNRDAILGCVLKHRFYRKYFFFTQRSKIDYKKYMLVSAP